MYSNDGRQPGPFDWQWQSRALGEDLLVIPHTDPEACKRLPCVYLIAVSAASLFSAPNLDCLSGERL
mgnify:CR=1 FL=1